MNITKKIMKQMAIQRGKNNAQLYQRTKMAENERKGKLFHLNILSEHLISDYSSQKPISVIQPDNGKFIAALDTRKYVELIAELTVERYVGLIIIAGF
jgi:hypothetical protein